MNTASESYEWFDLSISREDEFQLTSERINIIEHAPRGQSNQSSMRARPGSIGESSLHSCFVIYMTSLGCCTQEFIASSCIFLPAQDLKFALQWLLMEGVALRLAIVAQAKVSCIKAWLDSSSCSNVQAICHWIR